MIRKYKNVNRVMYSKEIKLKNFNLHLRKKITLNFLILKVK